MTDDMTTPRDDIPAGSSHPPDDALFDLVDGRLRGSVLREVETHVATCTACGELVAAARSGLAAMSHAAAGRGAGTSPVVLPADVAERLHDAVEAEYEARLAPGVRRAASDPSQPGRRHRLVWPLRVAALATVLAALTVGVVVTQHLDGSSSGLEQVDNASPKPAQNARPATSFTPGAAETSTNGAAADAAAATGAPDASGAASASSTDEAGRATGSTPPPVRAGDEIVAPAVTGDNQLGASSVLSACRQFPPTDDIIEHVQQAAFALYCAADQNAVSGGGRMHTPGRPSIAPVN